MDNKETADIIKVAALCINFKGELLIVKPKGADTWISLGGKIEEGETEVECLKREIKEELNAKANVEDTPYIKTPIEPAANKENTTVQITFYKVMLTSGIIPDGDEIEEYRWISQKDINESIVGSGIKIASGLLFYAIPKLIDDGLLK